MRWRVPAAFSRSCGGRYAVAAHAGTAAIALNLVDHDTPIWLDQRMSEDAGSRELAESFTAARLS